MRWTTREYEFEQRAGFRYRSASRSGESQFPGREQNRDDAHAAGRRIRDDGDLEFAVLPEVSSLFT